MVDKILIIDLTIYEIKSNKQYEKNGRKKVIIILKTIIKLKRYSEVLP